MKRILLFFVFFINFTNGYSQAITANTTTYTVPQLVQDVLFGLLGSAPCAGAVSNITWSTGSNFGAANGIGYFENTNPAFPFPSGVVLCSGSAVDTPGPNTSDLSSDGWSGDNQLFDYMQGLGIDPGLNSYNNATILEFDFVPLTTSLSFDFLFASEEYGTYQCSYSDAFAFFLTDMTAGTPPVNLALVPGTASPISVITIRDGSNSGCAASNPTFFGINNEDANAAAAAINFNGQTISMTATSNIIPNNLYHIKLVIADRNDGILDSAVFLGGGSFNIGQANISGTPLCNGSSGVLQASASPIAGATYSWTFNGVPIAGATGFNLTYSQLGIYGVTINLPSGCQISDTLEVNTTQPLPTASISASTTICSGTSTTITFIGTPSATVTYTINGGANQTIILNTSGTAVLTTPVLTSTTTYQLANVALGCSQSLTAASVITVTSPPIVAISGSTAVCEGNSATINFTGTPNATVVYTINNGSNQTIVLNSAGTASVSTGSLLSDVSYELVSVSLSSDCSQLQTGSASVVVAVPTVIATPASQVICSGLPTGIVLTSNFTNAAYSWTVNQIGVTGASPGTGNIISQVLTSLGSVGTAEYTITPTANGCAGLPITIIITVTPLPVATATPALQSVCSGTATNINFTSNIPGTTFSWNVVQTNMTGASAGTGDTIAQVLSTGTSPGEAVYIITPELNGCQGTPITTVITVNPTPVVTADPLQESICSGGTTNISLTSNVVGTTFSWTVTQTGLYGVSSGSGNLIQQTLTTVGTNQGTAIYTIIPTTNECIGAPITVTVSVNPVPEVFGSAVNTICSGGSPNIILSPNITGTTFSWTVVQTGVTGALGGTGDEINQILTATGTAQGTAIYTVIPSFNGCIGAPLDITVTVIPPPFPALEDGVICVHQATGTAFKTFTLDSGLSNTMYDFEWFYQGIPISGAFGNTYEANQEGIYSVIATSTITGCVSVQATATVVSSFPGLSLNAIQSPAFSDNTKVTVTVSGGNGTYEYQLDDGPFQFSNVFSNLTPGLHTVSVRDTNGCTDLGPVNVTVIGYPTYFTPNGDGNRDTWNIIGLNQQPDTNVYIYDRHGKLIKQISPTGPGWDGTYNGESLFSTDYWFVVEYLEGENTKIFKSHFSLKR